MDVHGEAGGSRAHEAAAAARHGRGTGGTGGAQGTALALPPAGVCTAGDSLTGWGTGLRAGASSRCQHGASQQHLPPPLLSSPAGSEGSPFQVFEGNLWQNIVPLLVSLCVQMQFGARLPT